jgi:hypothetical protein
MIRVIKYILGAKMYALKIKPSKELYNLEGTSYSEFAGD